MTTSENSEKKRIDRDKRKSTNKRKLARLLLMLKRRLANLRMKKKEGDALMKTRGKKLNDWLH